MKYMPLKIKIILTDENGNDYVGEVVLSPLPRKTKGKIIKAKVAPPTKMKKIDLDFDLSIYAFMKRISAKQLSGPLKMTALVAYLSKGDTNSVVKTADIRKQWLKMKSVLGKFNTFYYTPAKQNAWIHPVPPAAGKTTSASYKIRKEGLEILRKKI